MPKSRKIRVKKTTSKKGASSSSNKLPVWNLGLLYSSMTDPRIEADMKKSEDDAIDFAKKYDVADKTYLNNTHELQNALIELEKLNAEMPAKPLYYFFYLQTIQSSDQKVQAAANLINARAARIANCTKFFPLALGTITKQKQSEFLADEGLRHFHYFLKCIFEDAKHYLSLPEEKILTLKSQPAREMWMTQTEKLLGSQNIFWKGKKMPLSQALNLISSQKTPQLRKKMAAAAYESLKSIAAFSEGEINAVYTNKKIDDELRGFTTPYEETVLDYRNDPEVIEQLRKVVSDNVSIAHRFYALKAKLLKQKELNYPDRGAKIGTTTSTYTFGESATLLKKIFGELSSKYSDILETYIKEGRIDARPREGKDSGAYCSGSYANPTFVMLNHVDTLNSFTTFAHEMGHAFHTELSRLQGPIYSGYSYSLAETASTLFQAIALEGVFEALPDKEKIIVLHDKINDDISTIFRQIACFNFELELHTVIRAKGSVSKEEIAEIHNKNMREYLGPKFKMTPDDGYMFVSWSHIRRFFYVYSYAYGALVSKALLRKYKQDKTFWTKIETFLSAGGKASPEEILAEIGIDVRRSDFFEAGLKEIEDDIQKLEEISLSRK